MSKTDPRTTTTTGDGRTEVRYRARESMSRETKPSFMTSELWLGIIGVALLVGTYLVADDDSLNLWRTCLLGTILGAAYIVSRGFAKSGSQDHVDQDGYRRD
jgi:hypothetical protein